MEWYFVNGAIVLMLFSSIQNVKKTLKTKLDKVLVSLCWIGILAFVG